MCSWFRGEVEIEVAEVPLYLWLRREEAFPKWPPPTTPNPPTTNPWKTQSPISKSSPGVRNSSDKSIVKVAVPDRTSITSTESALVRETLNTSNTVKACITFLRYIKPASKEEMFAKGETKENPFLEFVALMGLQSGVNGFAKTVHGGYIG
ncbi:hypothetical protein G7Y89_g15012 [Cudoniella acicularis]|uniref:Uncharacterized protein n=1 Tax=Cudoniella acicularis TaxID=354080 RepID=A0A8H4QV59_9HELO|nr:hypothetical protein G7Y89_g15012 [Cudoniella acicularis]